MSFKNKKWVYLKGSVMIPKDISAEDFIEKMADWCKENDWSHVLTIDEDFSEKNVKPFN